MYSFYIIKILIILLIKILKNFEIVVERVRWIVEVVIQYVSFPIQNIGDLEHNKFMCRWTWINGSMENCTDNTMSLIPFISQFIL